MGRTPRPPASPPPRSSFWRNESPLPSWDRQCQPFFPEGVPSGVDRISPSSPRGSPLVEREYSAPVTTERLTGGQALARSLLGEGVEVVFGLPGVQLDWLFDALYEARDRLHVYHTRHEQATAYMADGYARTTGKVGVCAV